MIFISTFIHDYKTNIVTENNIPVDYLPYLKVSKHIPFVNKKTQKLIENLLPFINETALGLTIETEAKGAYVKVEVIHADIHQV